jgi:hypothetical protein
MQKNPVEFSIEFRSLGESRSSGLLITTVDFDIAIMNFHKPRGKLQQGGKADATGYDYGDVCIRN